MARKKKDVVPVQVEEPSVVIPNRVQVNGFDVFIRPMAGMEETALEAGGLYQWGDILLSFSSNPQRLAMCLVHEVLHACFDHSGLRYRFNNVNGHDAEEEIVSQLGFTLCQLIATQQEFVDFVQKAYNGMTVRYETEESGVLNETGCQRRRLSAPAGGKQGRICPK